MKKINVIKSLILGATIFSTTGIIAQTIVSTTPMNKRVVLEEYTGINCGYCPDGHKIAHDIQVAHPGVFFPIAIHEGSFAAPNSGQPDYRTSFGTALSTQAVVPAYPAGTINRHAFGHGMTASGDNGTNTALARNFWDADAATILGQTSCVNVAINPTVDYTTRVLTVLVEVYYTANSTATTNKLNVAICQNNVKGPQSNGSVFNPTMVTSDGKYLHQHMLRHLITGQWGISIPTTTAGTFFTQTFTYTLPAGYTSVGVEIPQLEIVAFVTEGNQEVLSADAKAVNQPSFDASVTAITGVPVYTCTGTFAPTATLKNAGTTTLTSATISYSVDGGTPATYNWTGSLATGATATVALPSVTSTGNGSHTLTISSSVPNGNTDWNLLNDSYSSSFAVFSSSTVTPLTQNFTSTTFPPLNYAIVDASADGLNWARRTAGHTAAGSAFIDFYNIASGKIDDLILPKADFTNTTGSTMTFWVAHRAYSATAELDKLEVDVSTNCGTTWIQKWVKSGSALTTGAAMGTAAFTTPTSTEWRQETVDLAAYNGLTDVLIRIRATSDYGNNAFVDDINVTGNITGFENPTRDAAINLFPNPSNGTMYLTNAENSSIEIFDMLGNLVYSKSIVSNNEQLDLSSLANGSYFARITNENNVATRNIVLAR
jgi:hypothetical protein